MGVMVKILEKWTENLRMVKSNASNFENDIKFGAPKLEKSRKKLGLQKLEKSRKGR